jgi:hypothetical protein
VISPRPLRRDLLRRDTSGASGRLASGHVGRDESVSDQTLPRAPSPWPTAEHSWTSLISAYALGLSAVAQPSGWGHFVRPANRLTLVRQSTGDAPAEPAARFGSRQGPGATLDEVGEIGAEAFRARFVGHPGLGTPSLIASERSPSSGRVRRSQALRRTLATWR